MTSGIHLTIVIATLNSELTLPLVLASVKKQTYPMKYIEILVIDGGSTDTTRKIARSKGCRVVENPKVFPAWAKFIGYRAARGDYIMFLDSDEVIENAQSIKRKLAVFKKNKQVRAVTGSGYKNPKGYMILNQYVNEFGDPFSYFIYRLSKNYKFFLHAMIQNYTVIEQNEDYAIFDFSKDQMLPIFELVAMGSIVDIRYLKKNFPEIIHNPGLVPHFFNLLVSKEAYIGIVKNDALIHYSADTLQKYLGKIRSRVVNNMFTPAKEGFTGREIFLRGAHRFKKYLFVPYSFSLVLPLADGLYLALTRRNIGYLVHVPLCLYTSFCILYYMCLKLLKIQPVPKSYGEQKVITT